MRPADLHSNTELNHPGGSLSEFFSNLNQYSALWNTLGLQWEHALLSLVALTTCTTTIAAPTSPVANDINILLQLLVFSSQLLDYDGDFLIGTRYFLVSGYQLLQHCLFVCGGCGEVIKISIELL